MEESLSMVMGFFELGEEEQRAKFLEAVEEERGALNKVMKRLRITEGELRMIAGREGVKERFEALMKKSVVDDIEYAMEKGRASTQVSQIKTAIELRLRYLELTGVYTGLRGLGEEGKEKCGEEEVWGGRGVCVVLPEGRQERAEEKVEEAEEEENLELRAQAGKQEEFLKTKADIAFYGGAAGGGKTYALLLECVRHVGVRGYGAVIFRQQSKQITHQGGLLDTAKGIYLGMSGVQLRANMYKFLFYEPGKPIVKGEQPLSTISFNHISRDADVYSFQGSQIPLVCFDELTHFTKAQFFYMLSRNRSTCGINPYVRATTNPDAESWVRDFIDWWIDDAGYAIEERSGVLRYFVHKDDFVTWFASKEEAKKAFPDISAKSFTFISAKIDDNKILCKLNPEYKDNLQALIPSEKEKLLHGNWNVIISAGDYFKRSYFEVVSAVPVNLKVVVRCWDLASTKPSESNPDPDYTVGIKCGVDEHGKIYVMDMVRDRVMPAGVRKMLKNTASLDGKNTYIRIPEDPGSSGKMVVHDLITMLAGYAVHAKKVTGTKELRASIASTQSEVGNVCLLKGTWNEQFLTELERFPIGVHDDIVDAFSDCVEELTQKSFAKTVSIPRAAYL